MASPSRLPSIRRAAGNPRPASMVEGPMSNVPHLGPPSTEAESKKAKRRSLLPQFSRKATAEERDAASGKEDSASGDGDSSRPSDDRPDPIDLGGIKDVDEDRKSMPPPLSKPSRPMSMIPPRGSSQASSSKLPGTRAHKRNASKEQAVDSQSARAQSPTELTGTVSSTAPAKVIATETSLKRTGSIRLPPQPRADGPMIPSRTTSVRTRVGEVSPPSKTSKSRHHSKTSSGADGNTTSSRLRPPGRSNLSADLTTAGESSTARPESSSSMRGSREPAANPISPPRSSLTSRARPTSQIILPSSTKPAFNTFQQHYSPAKSSLPKPPVPSGKHAPKPSLTIEHDESINFDTARQQIELLQLSLLHRSSAKCMNEYVASAKRKLSKKHNKLRREYEDLRAMELVHQRASNISALDAWCGDTDLMVENLQILSLVYSDLTSLMEEGSRHGGVVAVFELWMNEAETCPPGTFTQPLPDDWRASHSSLALKLRSMQRNLRVLPPVQAEGQGSGVNGALRACKTLVEDMGSELEVMLRLEREMMARETGKVEREVDMMMTNHDGGLEGRWIPAWQKV